MDVSTHSDVISVELSQIQCKQTLVALDSLVKDINTIKEEKIKENILILNQNIKDAYDKATKTFDPDKSKISQFTNDEIDAMIDEVSTIYVSKQAHQTETNDEKEKEQGKEKENVNSSEWLEMFCMINNTFKAQGNSTYYCHGIKANDIDTNGEANPIGYIYKDFIKFNRNIIHQELKELLCNFIQLRNENKNDNLNYCIIFQFMLIVILVFQEVTKQWMNCFLLKNIII